MGRYDRQKGIDILLKAMARLEGQGFSLTMIGAPVIGRPSRIALPTGVEDLGWQPSEVVAAAIDRADVVVMPSRWEAFGFVALEAMRAARPVIACAVEGLPELVLDGETGLFCRPGCPDALADAIEAISTMDARSMGIRARRRYERDFTAERMFHRIDAVYRGEGRVLN